MWFKWIRTEISTTVNGKGGEEAHNAIEQTIQIYDKATWEQLLVPNHRYR
jgi:hypothetical protein